MVTSVGSSKRECKIEHYFKSSMGLQNADPAATKHNLLRPVSERRFPSAKWPKQVHIIAVLTRACRWGEPL